MEDAGLGDVAALPYSIRVLLGIVLRNCDGYEVTEDDVKALAGWQAESPAQVEIPFKPARVVLQDFTGVPCVVDLAAMRAAMQRLGGDPKKINPLVPVDLVIDHSVQVDYFGSADALDLNVDMEFERNRERYEFLRWGQKAFDNFRVVPPGIGIVHQVNLEYLAKVRVPAATTMRGTVAFPDSLVGTDSHTTMINGLGVVGWGVGGIEAEAVMLGQPIYMLLPEVIGFELTGQLLAGRHGHRPGAHRDANPPQGRRGRQVRRVLRARRVDDDAWPIGPRSATWRPNTARRWASSRSTTKRSAISARPAARRPKSSWSNVTRKSKACSAPTPRPVPTFTKVVRLDLATVEPSLAGPKRPQDRVPLSQHEAGLATGAAQPSTASNAPNGSPEGRWEGEGGHKIEPAAAAHPTPAALKSILASTAYPSSGTTSSSS